MGWSERKVVSLLIGVFPWFLFSQEEQRLSLASLHFFSDGTVIAKWTQEIKQSGKEIQVILIPLILVDSLWYRLHPDKMKVVTYMEPAFLKWKPRSFTDVLNAYKGKKVDLAINQGRGIEEFEGYLFSFFPENDPQFLCLLVEGNRLQCFHTGNIAFILPMENDSISYAFHLQLEKNVKSLELTYYGKWTTPHPWQWIYSTTIEGKNLFLDKYIQVTFPSRIPAIKTQCYFYEGPFISEDSLGHGYVWRADLVIASGISGSYYVGSDPLKCEYQALVDLPPVSKFSPAGPGLATLINFQTHSIDTLYCVLEDGKKFPIPLEAPLSIENRERVQSLENGDTLVVGEILFHNTFSDPITLFITKKVHGNIVALEGENRRGKERTFKVRKSVDKDKKERISYQYHFSLSDEKDY